MPALLIRRFRRKENMQRVSMILVMSGVLAATSGCATKNFVRTSVKTSADALSARIDTNESEIKELRDDTDKKVAGVDQKVTALDAKTTQTVNGLKTDIQSADQHAGQAQGAATQAQGAADRAGQGVTALDGRFQNRNQFNTSTEKTVQFKFNSATLDKEYTDALDEIASTLMQSPNSIVVLEGRTDSTGDKNYNLHLGERRVDAVRHYLVVEKGVPVYKIHDISFGSEKPVAENNTKEGREKNRAVVLTVMVPKSEGSVASRNN
jgi:outer membrane protein OmpA-like peptidoglycan-associated protein